MSAPGRTPELDVAVVGGGPVGLMTAIHARRAGLTVAVFDQRDIPVDKACGEGLMPDAVEMLRRVDALPSPKRCAVFRGIRYVDGEFVAEARFQGGNGLGIRRTELQRRLAERAAALGACLNWRVRVGGVHTAGSRAALETSKGRVDARWVVGADGLHSRVRRWAGLAGRSSGIRKDPRRRFGVRLHFAVEPWTDLVEVHWGDRLEAYVTPVSPREVGVALLGPETPGEFSATLRGFPGLWRRLAGAPVTTPLRGMGPLDRPVAQAHRGRVALVGDASGYLDAITGEGLALGFHQAEALAEVLRSARSETDLARYGVAVRRLRRWPFALIRLLLAVERRPGLRRRMVGALARDPELFSRFLAIHARQRPAGASVLTAAVKMARGLLLAPG